MAPEDVQSVTNSRKPFHARGLIVVRRVARTNRAEEDVDRRRRHEVTATGSMTSCNL